MPGVVYENELDGRTLSDKDKCPIKGSELCYWLAEGKCYQCYANKIKDADTRIRMSENWKVMLSNLPDDIDDLGNSDTCVLCKGHAPNKAECYGQTDLAHPDPPAKKGVIMGLGKKVRIPIGSMFTLNFAACKQCRRKMRMVDGSFILWFIGMIAGGIIFVCTPFFSGTFGENALLIGLGIIVAFALAGWFIGKACQKAYVKKVAKSVRVDLREIPQVGQMFRNRWFIYDGNKERRSEEFKVFFSSKKTFKNIYPPEDFAVDSESKE